MKIERGALVTIKDNKEKWPFHRLKYEAVVLSISKEINAPDDSEELHDYMIEVKDKDSDIKFFLRSSRTLYESIMCPHYRQTLIIQNLFFRLI